LARSPQFVVQFDEYWLPVTGWGLEAPVTQNGREIPLSPRQALLGFQSPNIISVNLVLAKKKKKAKKAMKKKARRAAKKRVVKRKPPPAPVPVAEPAPAEMPPAPPEGTTSSTPSQSGW
jgi:hypothetical protein